ncbi:YhjD/YihY/BrkB family envelope integrity protein [Streptomyces sp. NPDC004647]|uniref:YhjD/YihY/BrkB family envelope integrity protein n=1 Tax=Streptomyces sp. NPDC004647 TaxID=3154671 RepID=UPI0033A58B7E
MANKSSGSEGRGPFLGRLYHAFHRSTAKRGWKRANELELTNRSMGFAALGFLTLVPLLIVVAAADPTNGQGFARWLGDGLGVSREASQEEIEQLFAKPRQALETTTAFGLAALAVFGLTFGSSVQTGYEKVWELPAARWHTMWRHLVWLATLIGYLYLSAHSTLEPDRPGQAAQTTFRLLVAVLSAVLFFWWSQRLLLGGRIGWVALLPGAVSTVIGLIGLRVFSKLVFSPLIASNAVTYGPFGTVLVVQSWLVGVGTVVFGGALVGRLIHEEFPRVADRLRRRK